VIDGSEDADREQADADLQRRLRQGREDGRQADADEEYGHHTVPVPFVGKPAGRQREQAEGKESRRRVGQQRTVTQPPFPGQRERRHGGEDQHEQVVEEMSDVQEQEMQSVSGHGQP